MEVVYQLAVTDIELLELVPDSDDAQPVPMSTFIYHQLSKAIG